ncbi:MAG: prephenate dehydratase [Pirellulales bacterium]|nr:prephenate dehydratase [Pirellulales bacterium]
MGAKQQTAKNTPAQTKKALGLETKQLIRSVARHLQCFATAAEAHDPDLLRNYVKSTITSALSAKKYTGIRNTIGELVGKLAENEFNTHRSPSVAFLGPLYSYSHLATSRYFGKHFCANPVATIAHVFDDVSKTNADFGVVPIENSTDGRIVDTLNVLARSTLSICGEINLPIHHTLLSLSTMDSITTVYSKPQALSQCRDWLAEHLPNAELVDTPSTTVAAEIASTTKGAAAIASTLAGEHYGLTAVASKIEDRLGNVTRFAILGNDIPKPTGNDKTTLIVELKHAPGALADAMISFKKQRLNLTWIESFPKPNRPSEYFFFIELEGHRDDPPVVYALRNIERNTQRISVIGSFPKHG